jgi:nicotinamidase-related amidase
MKPDGKLYVPEAESIIPNLLRLTDYAHERGIRIVASTDDHIPGHRELHHAPDFRETFPDHCMRGTLGQRKIPETTLRNPLVIDPEPRDLAELQASVRRHDGDILFNKHWFDVFTNANVEPVLEVIDPDDIILYGVALDVCNRYAIEGLLQRRPTSRIFAVTDAMKPIDKSSAEHLLKEWGEAGVRLVRTDEAVEKGGGLVEELIRSAV